MENPNIVAYSQNDFIWTTMATIDCPTNVSCTKIDGSATDIEKCLQYEYCRNKDYSNQVLNGPANHIGAQGRFIDSKDDYNINLQTTINLGIGILGIGIFIFYNI
jgi:hypothetical protein